MILIICTCSINIHYYDTHPPFLPCPLGSYCGLPLLDPSLRRPRPPRYSPCPRRLFRSPSQIFWRFRTQIWRPLVSPWRWWVLVSPHCRSPSLSYTGHAMGLTGMIIIYTKCNDKCNLSCNNWNVHCTIMGSDWEFQNRRPFWKSVA